MAGVRSGQRGRARAVAMALLLLTVLNLLAPAVHWPMLLGMPAAAAALETGEPSHAVPCHEAALPAAHAEHANTAPAPGAPDPDPGMAWAACCAAAAPLALAAAVPLGPAVPRPR